jgi:hypothetical protein
MVNVQMAERAQVAPIMIHLGRGIGVMKTMCK